MEHPVTGGVGQMKRAIWRHDIQTMVCKLFSGESACYIRLIMRGTYGELETIKVKNWAI